MFKDVYIYLYEVLETNRCYKKYKLKAKLNMTLNSLICFDGFTFNLLNIKI